MTTDTAIAFEVPSGYTLVVGLGISGQAIARHLHRQGVPFVVVDSRDQPPGEADFRKDFPGIALYCGALDKVDMQAAVDVIVSPGVDPHQPALAQAKQRLKGELELFKRALPTDARVIAITGSNAKSTVTTLVGDMARAAGIDAGVGGNLGTPALTLLEQGHDLYVLELSSFQLESVEALAPDVACFLNLSEDHLDRHGDMAGYARAKQRIFEGAAVAVINADDRATWPGLPVSRKVAFTTHSPALNEWGIQRDGNVSWLAHGNERWIDTRELRLAGLHNQANVLAALAIGNSLGWPREKMLETIRGFSGLPHRMEYVGSLDGVSYINDSKGTNVGASLAAIEGLAPVLEGRILWLGGGVGKGADFTPLAAPLAKSARGAFLFGRDRGLLTKALAVALPCEEVQDMEQALECARTMAAPGDVVLLSPACASLDQFPNYQARGDAFRRWFSCQDDKNTSVGKEQQ